MDDYLFGNFYRGGRYCLVILFGAVAMSLSLSLKVSRKKAAIKWTGILLLAFITGFCANYTGNILADYANAVTGLRSTFQIQLLYFAVTCSNVFINTIPALFVVGASLTMYQAKRNMKIFVSILFMIIAASVIEFFTQITCIFFSPGSDEYFRFYPGYMVRMLIDIVWMTAALVAYRHFFRNKLVNILEYAGEQICHIILVPAISFVAFEIVVSTLSTYNITVMASDPASFLISLIVTVSMLVIYLLMYWAIFKAVMVSAKSAKSKAELDVASKIQLSALPGRFPAFPKRKEIDIYAAMHPAKEVGGDFYDFFFVDEGHLAVLIADVSGKGVPAALFMMSGRAIIRNQALLGVNPGTIFTNANKQLAENNKESMFITAFLGILDVNSGEFMYCNAGHNTPYICQQDGKVIPFEMDSGFVLGGLKRTKYETGEAMLGIHEKLVLYTDGVTEAINSKMEMYMEKRLEETLRGCGTLTVKETVENIGKSVSVFVNGAEQSDDITLLAVERTGQI